MQKKLIMISAVSVMVSLGLFLACGESRSNADMPEGKRAGVAEEVKDFTLTLMDGNKLTINDVQGKAVILNVWDTWCPPCKAEIPDFIQLFNEYKDKGLVIVGIAGGRYGKEAVQQFIEEKGINYVNALLDPQFNQTYGPITAIPTTFVLDRNGKIYKKYVGYTDKSQFDNDIKAILGI